MGGLREITSHPLGPPRERNHIPREKSPAIPSEHSTKESPFDPTQPLHGVPTEGTKKLRTCVCVGSTPPPPYLGRHPYTQKERALCLCAYACIYSHTHTHTRTQRHGTQPPEGNEISQSAGTWSKLPCLFKSLVPRECYYPPPISSILNRLAESLPQRLKFISKTILFSEKMPTIGIEPTTYGLQNRCSTIEPSRQVT